MNTKGYKKVRFDLNNIKKSQREQPKVEAKQVFNQSFDKIKLVVIGYLRQNNLKSLHFNIIVPYLCFLLQTELCIKPLLIGQQVIHYKDGSFDWIVPQLSDDYEPKFTMIPLFLPHSIGNIFNHSTENQLVFKFNWIRKCEALTTNTVHQIGIVICPKDVHTQANILSKLAKLYTTSFRPEFIANCAECNVKSYFVSIIGKHTGTDFEEMSLWLHCCRLKTRWNMLRFKFTVRNQKCAMLHGHTKLKQVRVNINKQDCFVFTTSSFRVRQHSYDMKMKCFTYYF